MKPTIIAVFVAAVLAAAGALVASAAIHEAGIAVLVERIAAIEESGARHLVRTMAVEEELRDLERGRYVERTEAMEVELVSVQAAIDSHGGRLAGLVDELQRLRSAELERREDVDSVLGDLRASAEDLAVRLETQDRRFTDLEDTLVRLATERRDELPVGSIVAWMPPPGAAAPPSGWEICDGRNGTPDLRGLFLRGVGSFDRVGTHRPASTVSPAGLHAHATQENRSIYNLSRASPKEQGDWLILFDAGVIEPDAEGRLRHGEHVHEDENIPEHFAVIYVMKLEAMQGEQR